MNLKLCVVALFSTAIAASLPSTNAAVCPSTLGCAVNSYSPSNLRISQCCESRGGDFAACCAASCSSGSP
ncbi:hypothetical protein PHYSODRAFT_458407, partial [Phytophthora sojae]